MIWVLAIFMLGEAGLGGVTTPAQAESDPDVLSFTGTSLTDETLSGIIPTGSVASGLRAVITPRRQAMLSSQIAARIVELALEEGDSFEKGQTLVSFDCGNFEGRRDKAQAELSAAQEAYASARELDQMGGISRLDVVLAESDMKAAKATARIAAWNVSHCHIKAPYSGRVVERLAQAYETVTIGDDVMSILSDSDLEVRVIIPSTGLRTVTPGTQFSFSLEETGALYRAEVATVGAKIDPVSQTVEIRGRIVSPDPVLTAGMSGHAVFAATQTARETEAGTHHEEIPGREIPGREILGHEILADDFLADDPLVNDFLADTLPVGGPGNDGHPRGDGPP